MHLLVAAFIPSQRKKLSQGGKRDWFVSPKIQESPRTSPYLQTHASPSHELLIENFQSSLSDEDRANFKSFQDPSSMIEAIKEPFLAKADKSRLLAACRKVESFAKKLNGFFPVIDIFVSSHPEYAALAWGAIRLVFQVYIRPALFPPDSQILTLIAA